MSGVCYCVLAYADDTVFVCDSKESLLRTMGLLEEWCVKNKIAVNKKKSGIIIVNDDGEDPSYIEEYPVVPEYKYLGIMIDSKLTPRYHIDNIKNKVSEYFKRNFMIHKNYFTPLSLIRIVDYFVKSRLAYGLSCFLDSPSTMKRLEDVLMKHLRSIFGLPANTSARRLSLTLGEPNITTRLAVRLLKNWHKYHMHFGEYPYFYEKILRKYFSEEEIFPRDFASLNFYEIKFRLINQDLKKLSGETLNIEIRNNHREFLKRYVFNWSDLRNFLVIRYFTRTTKGTCNRLFPVCECGSLNTPEHGANDCPLTLKDRIAVKAKFDFLFACAKLEKKNTIFEYLHEVFFCIDGIKASTIRQLINHMKVTIMSIILNDKSVDGRLVGKVENEPLGDEVNVSLMDTTVDEAEAD